MRYILPHDYVVGQFLTKPLIFIYTNTIAPQSVVLITVFIMICDCNFVEHALVIVNVVYDNKIFLMEHIPVFFSFFFLKILVY